MYKILVVDDEEVMRNLMRMRLKDTYEVIDTGTPEQAIALALEHKPDAALMDLMMPKFSGFELCQSLRALSYTAMVPAFCYHRRVRREIPRALPDPGRHRILREAGGLQSAQGAPGKGTAGKTA